MMIHLRKFSQKSLEIGITLSKLPDLEISESRPQTPLVVLPVDGRFLDCEEEILERDDDGNIRQRASDEESVIGTRTIRIQAYSVDVCVLCISAR